jgi:hypothetical protein
MNAINPDDFPQLRAVTWNRQGVLLQPEEALALYERNWRHVDQKNLETGERTLIEELVRTVGHGVFHGR